MYYESHITIEPVFDKTLETVQQLALQHKFKVADLLMQKKRETTPERSSKDTFMTGHSLTCVDLTERMKSLILDLKRLGFKVYRYKIEHIVIDSRAEDIFGMNDK